MKLKKIGVYFFSLVKAFENSLSFRWSSPSLLRIYTGLALGLCSSSKTLFPYLSGCDSYHVDDLLSWVGEWNDLKGDRLNQNFNAFSGGSRILVQGLLPPWIALFLGYGCLLGAVVFGLYLYFQYKTGQWPLLLGGMGLFSGYFYSCKSFDL